MKHTKNIFLISSLILTILNAHVGSPDSFKVYQPDGTEIDIFIKGDHLHNWHVYKGWTVVKIAIIGGFLLWVTMIKNSYLLT